MSRRARRGPATISGMTQPELDSMVAAYYARGGEDTRLRAGEGRLELIRTQDVLRRVLPAPPADVLDVGGGSGVHAEWLAADGHRVRLVEPVPGHVARAAELPGVSAALGDARSLPEDDAAYDAVLLLGPLYHLLDRDDRVRALAEARRVVRPGGLVVAATINRLAGVLDMARKNRFGDAASRASVTGAARTGALRPQTDVGFTTAYFHRPEDVPGEFTDAGLPCAGQYSVEGALWLLGDVDARLDDPVRREDLLDAIRYGESEPSLLGASGHLLTVGRRPH